VEWIAHRGAKTEFPENTLAAFARAFERGADAIELDVHATADGEVVVHHDPEVSAPADANGSARKRLAIASATLRDLRALGAETEEMQIPTLAAVLASVPQAKTVYVEIKGARIEEAVADVLARSVARTAVHSFDHEAIGRMRQLAPDVPRGILLDRRPRDVVQVMRAVEARDVWPDAMIADRALIDAVHDAGGRVIVWTVNHPAEARRLIGLGVDGICTDDVRLRADPGRQESRGRST
jgi:glycerophosphoryl diester phosphodiesterase